MALSRLTDRDLSCRLMWLQGLVSKRTMQGKGALSKEGLVRLGLQLAHNGCRWQHPYKVATVVIVISARHADKKYDSTECMVRVIV